MQGLRAGSITWRKSEWNGRRCWRVGHTVRCGYQSPQIERKGIFTTVKKPVSKGNLLAFSNLQISAICIPKHNSTSGFRKNNFTFIDRIPNLEDMPGPISSHGPYFPCNISDSS